MLSRITEPTSGFAEVRAKLEALLEVGIGFHPELTGWENIFFNGAILGMRRPGKITKRRYTDAFSCDIAGRSNK